MNSISAKRQDPLEVHAAEQQKTSLLLIIVAKLKFVGFTEQLASVTHFLSHVCSGIGCITVALHPETVCFGAVPLQCLVIPLCALYFSLQAHW